MFIATLINQEFMVKTFSVFFPSSYYFRIWQPVTYMFMHGGIAHIFVNMWGLLMFGSALERTIGTRKYLILYFLAGFGALLVHLGVEYIQVQQWYSSMAMGRITQETYYMNLNTPMLGASGAIYGVQVAYAMLYPNDVWMLIFPPVRMKAKWFILIFLALELYLGVTGTVEGVAHFAHLGGALVGFLLILVWKRTGRLWNNH
jgi:membrane associated rhomboid family serine protease